MGYSFLNKAEYNQEGCIVKVTNATLSQKLRFINNCNIDEIIDDYYNWNYSQINDYRMNALLIDNNNNDSRYVYLFSHVMVPDNI